MTYNKIIILLVAVLCMASCTELPTNVQRVNELPPIYPDYVGVTIPVGIAPMDFCPLPTSPKGEETGRIDVIVKGNKSGEIHANGEYADFDIDEWHQLVEQNKGGELTFTVCIKQDGQWKQYDDFKMYVSNYDLEEWGLTYRRIAPGYEAYGQMGLYQRDLSTFDEYEIIQNTRTPGYCVNCHTSNRTNSQQFVFHARGENPSTILYKDGKVQSLNTKTNETLGLCVYPYWHPSGRYVAFSTNTTRQSFHVVKDERIEVFDQASDLQILNTETNELIVSPLTKGEDSWETYPVFSPDGKTLYFCSAVPKSYPQEYKEVKYALCKMSFDASTGNVGDKVDTLISAADCSVTFPRPSYDGKWIMFTKSNYGCFPIWHREADLWLMNTKTGESRPISEVNSDDTDSFHNWSDNSHWFVFSSRRGDGLYTRLYLSSIDEKGKATKPFLLPQKNPQKYYEETLFSFNVPDFTKQKVELDARIAASKIRSEERVDVRVKQ